MADRTLTGILLVGGTSSRFGSPKALARFEGETLAERAWRLLGEVCDERLVVGGDGLTDPGTGPVAAIGVGLGAATNDVAIVVPVDMPLLTAAALRQLAESYRTETGTALVHEWRFPSPDQVDFMIDGIFHYVLAYVQQNFRALFPNGVQPLPKLRSANIIKANSRMTRMTVEQDLQRTQQKPQPLQLKLQLAFDRSTQMHNGNA